MVTATELDADSLRDFVPMAQRVLSIDTSALLRLRASGGRIAGFVRLPYDVLAGRSLAVDIDTDIDFDVTVAAGEFAAWVDSGRPAPARQDAGWLSPLPPRQGWQRLETVPEATVRGLVAHGARLAPLATGRASQQALLASVVLTATSGPHRVDVPLGPFSALTRLGFLPPDSQVVLDVTPGWIRVAARFGSAYVARPGPGLNLLTL